MNKRRQQKCFVEVLWQNRTRDVSVLILVWCISATCWTEGKASWEKKPPSQCSVSSVATVILVIWALRFQQMWLYYIKPQSCSLSCTFHSITCHVHAQASLGQSWKYKSSVLRNVKLAQLSSFNKFCFQILCKSQLPEMIGQKYFAPFSLKLFFHLTVYTNS